MGTQETQIAETPGSTGNNSNSFKISIDMNTIKVDSELLRQPWQEKLLDQALDFRAVHDYLSRPVIFVLHQNGKLLLLTPDDNAELCVFDLSAKFGLQSSQKISTIAVSQATSLETYLVFAATSQDTTIPDNLWVLPGLSLGSPGWPENIENISAFKGSGPNSKLVSKLLLVSPWKHSLSFSFLDLVFG